MKKLTEKQNAVLEFIKKEISTNYCTPTYKMIADGLGIDQRAAFDRVAALADKGVIELYSPKNQRSKIIRVKGFPLLSVPELMNGIAKSDLSESYQEYITELVLDMAKQKEEKAISQIIDKDQSNRELTARQSEIYQYLKHSLLDTHHIPTYREVGDHFSISVKAAYDHVKALEKKGFLEMVKHSESGKAHIKIVGLNLVGETDGC